MNMMLNRVNPTPAAAAAADPAALPAAAAAAPPGASAMPAAAVLPGFAQWLGLGQQADSAALRAPADTGVDDEDCAAGIPDATDPVTEQQAAAAPQDSVLLAAMAMPLPLQAAVPAFANAGLPANDPARSAVAGGDDAIASGAAALPLSAAALRTGLRRAALPGAGAAPAQAGAVPLAGDARDVITAAVALAGDAPGTMLAAASALPAPLPVRAAASALPAPLPMRAAAIPAATSAPGAAADAGPQAAAASADAAPLRDGADAPAADRQGGGWGVTSAAPAAGRLAADSVALAGPPAAWRQTLHEALGERLNLQLSKNAEQAVIRLDPPMLGRIEIAIRHSGGALEISLSATHSEVLRQLHSVSDNLRNDLAQRQFTEVAVTVAAAARGNGAAQSGDPQGRGRQPARDDQPQDPGRALAEAGDAASTFTLNGRP